MLNGDRKTLNISLIYQEKKSATKKRKYFTGELEREAEMILRSVFVFEDSNI